MKPIRNLYISGRLTHLIDADLRLELSACGRGFLTVKTDESDLVKKTIALDVGDTSTMRRWFTGYVERAQPADNGSQRLFVREFVGVLERDWPVSFQHPTLRQLCDHLSTLTPIKFDLPAAAYVDKPIPHFQHAGSGYQLLNNLGRAFEIDDYVWHQLPAGSVFVGSWQDSMFKGKNYPLPATMTTATAGGNSVKMMLIPTMRPGFIVNSKRLLAVDLKNDDMTLTMEAGTAAAKSPARRQIEKEFPELAAGLHMPRYARVEAPADSANLGDQYDPFRPRYAVNVQLLDENGKPARNTPVFNAVPLPLPFAGGESGMMQYPAPGTMVELSFDSGRPDKPRVRQTVPDSTNLPAIKPGEQLQQQRAEVFQRVHTDGSWQRETDQAINESSAVRDIKADVETRTLTDRATTIGADDTLTVGGTQTTAAGAIQQVVEGDIASITGGNRLTRTDGNSSNETGGDLSVQVDGAALVQIVGKLDEMIGTIRKSTAGTQQQILAPSIILGNGELNLLTCLTDTLDIVKTLAEHCANHTHTNDGYSPPSQAAQFSGDAARCSATKQKYNSMIG